MPRPAVTPPSPAAARPGARSGSLPVWLYPLLLGAGIAAGISQPAAAWAGTGGVAPAAEALPADQLDFFERQVRPLLAKRCFGCHGGTKAEGGLSLATATGWQRGGESGPAIVPGRPEESLLVEAIRYESPEMPPAERAAGIVATGYLAIARRFGHDIEHDMHLTHEDAIDSLGKSFLGLSVACARCHDHKYDPINAADYYALYGILASTRFAFPGCEATGQPRDMVPLIPEADRPPATSAAVAEPPPAIPVAYAVVDRDVAKNARLHERGEPEKLGAEVPRRWLEVFGGAEVPTSSESGRRELAAWITGQPLFARVIVNRVWGWHFGRGIVASANDFGGRGEPPTHPELLDRLAAEFVRSGFSIKALHRAIMLTAAYQRASATPAAADPDNRWLAHFSRRRLDAEELRDSLLTVSGRIDLSFAEAHPFPPEETWKFTQHHPFSAVYETNRRSAFLMVQRQRRHPFLALFDGADPNASTPSRQTTTVARPSIGSWVTYGLGTLNRNLPGFVVIAPHQTYAGTQVYASDFLPGAHQGTDTGSANNWDAHGDMLTPEPLAKNVDRPIAALLRDLKQRGMLDETLAVWTTEFGRTPFNNTADAKGREHHPWAFSSWLAGGGVKPGIVHGATDEIGLRAVEQPVHVRDFHATILHLMGFDHERLSYRHAGLDFRLTGVEPAHVVKELLA